MKRFLLAALMVTWTGYAQAQTPTTAFSTFIQGLSSAIGNANPTDVIYLNQGGVSKKATISQLNFAPAGNLAVSGGGTGQTSFTSNLPLIGNGLGALAQGTRSGNTTKFVTSNGTLTNGHCAGFDANGNLVDEGGACTVGGGGGTVAAGSTNQIGYYSAATTTIVGSTLTIGSFSGTAATVAQVPQLPLVPSNIAPDSSVGFIGGPTTLGWNAGRWQQCLTSGGMQIPAWTTCQGGGGRNVLRNSSLIDSRCGVQTNSGAQSGWGTETGCTVTITTAGGWCAEGVFIIPVGASITCLWQPPNSSHGQLQNINLTGGAGVTDIKLRFVQDTYEAYILRGQMVTLSITFQNSSATFYPTLTTASATALDNFSSVTTDLSGAQMGNCPTQTSQNVNCQLAFTWMVDQGAKNGYEETIDLNLTDTAASGIAIEAGFDMRLTPEAAPGPAYAPPFPELDPALDHVRDQRCYQQYGGWHGNLSQLMGIAQSSTTANILLRFDQPMRAPPSVTFNANNALGGVDPGNGGFSTTVGATNAGYESVILTATFGSVSLTSGNAYIFNITGAVSLDACLTGG